jgi:hypothetical protein
MLSEKSLLMNEKVLFMIARPLAVVFVIAAPVLAGF